MIRLRWLAKLLLACLLLTGFAGPSVVLAAPAQSVARVTRANPPMWQMHTATSTITFFGTVHVLSSDIDWHSPALAAAFRAADEVVFEVPVDERLSAALAKVAASRSMLPAGQTLTSQLPAVGQQRLAAVAAKLGWARPAYDDKQPWLVAMQIEAALLQRSGMGEAGPDFKLMAEAKAAGKSVDYLETVDQQIALLAPSDPAMERMMLENALDGFDEADEKLKSLVQAWCKGDARAVADVIGQDMQDAPQLRAFFLTNRNHRWARQIAGMARAGKNILVVVGIGHLVGKDSVPELLRAEGFTVTGP